MKEPTQLYDLDAEMSTLGAIILKNAAFWEVSTIVEEFDFYLPAHREVYSAITSLMAKGVAVDLITVSDCLKSAHRLESSGGTDYLVTIAESVPMAVNAVYYAQIVRNLALQRQLNTAGHELVNLSTNSDAGSIQDRISAAEAVLAQVSASGAGIGAKSFVPLKRLAVEYIERLDSAIEGTASPLIGIPSGISELDKILGGFQPGQLIIVAARPGGGKTALALKFAASIASRGVITPFFSIEMTDKEIIGRLVSMQSKLPTSILRKSNLSVDECRALLKACEILHELPLYVNDSSDITTAGIQSELKRLGHEFGIVFIDYLQIISIPKKDSREQEVASITRALKRMAKSMNVPIIAMAQLSRDVTRRQDKTPTLSDLRESGSLEQEADVVLAPHRPNLYLPPSERDDHPDRIEKAEIHVLKHRNGPTGVVPVAFCARSTEFGDIA